MPLSKLPFYLGLSVLVVSVIVSAVVVGERTALTSGRSKAEASGSSLALSFSPPNLMSLTLVGEKEIAGVDVVITFEKEKITILPSTLSSGPGFITTGGVVEEEKGTFSFSALPKGPTTSGIVASFKVQPKAPLTSLTSELKFKEEEGATAIIEKATNLNILKEGKGVKFSLTSS